MKNISEIVWGRGLFFVFLFQVHFNIPTVIWLFLSGILYGNQIHSQTPYLKFSSLRKCGHKKFALSLFTIQKRKPLKRQKHLQSYNLTSFRESYCRKEHLEYCSESLKPNKKTEYTWFKNKISVPIVCTDSNLRYSWSHILQWTYTIPREQKGCQSTWLNHSETHNINLLAGQRLVRELQAEPENKTLVMCHSTNVSQEKKIKYQAPKREYKQARSSAFTWEWRHEG